MANAFGLGLLESPALLPFLPALSERVLGAPLELPIVPSDWQLGPEPGRKAVSSPAASAATTPHPGLRPDPAAGRLPDVHSRSTWMNRLTFNPSAYVVPDVVPLSHAPVWRESGLESRGLMLRVFVVADRQGDYRLLPAALTRVALDSSLSLSAQRGGASKDTWIVGAASPGEPSRASEPREQGQLFAERRTVTSRAAEHLFWLGRYAERSENAARLTRSILSRLTQGGVLPGPLIACMVRRSADEGLLNADDLSVIHGDPGLFPTGRLVAALTESVFDRTKRSGLNFGVDHATRAAGAIRERLSYDNWRLLTQLARRLTPRSTRPDVDLALEAVDDAILSLVAAGGLEMAHMTRDDGWRFLSLGRHLERLAFMSATLTSVSTSAATEEPAVLDWILDVSDSLITYRTRYRRVPEWPAVIDLLLFDGHNPRSVLFQVSKLARHVRLLPGNTLQDLVLEIETLERAKHPDVDDEVERPVPVPSVAGTATLLAACYGLAERLSDALTLQYFSHVYDTQHATVNA
jgi:uncharacterized alpha-E superfamily protein